jgi:hypothetical protein
MIIISTIIAFASKFALADAINGAFELGAGLFTWMNITRLYRDKKLSGVHWLPTCFFTIWGCYNLYFYWALGLTLSWYGGLSIFGSNMIWLGMVYYYKKVYKNV